MMNAFFDNQNTRRLTNPTLRITVPRNIFVKGVLISYESYFCPNDIGQLKELWGLIRIKIAKLFCWVILDAGKSNIPRSKVGSQYPCRFSCSQDEWCGRQFLPGT
jgi:hypothetical protein